LGAKPFRFLYISGSNTIRDQNKKPLFMGDYILVRVCCNIHFDLQPVLSTILLSSTILTNLRSAGRG
jgi:hypothetical protein